MLVSCLYSYCSDGGNSFVFSVIFFGIWVWGFFGRGLRFFFVNGCLLLILWVAGRN